MHMDNAAKELQGSRKSVILTKVSQYFDTKYLQRTRYCEAQHISTIDSRNRKLLQAGVRR